MVGPLEERMGHLAAAPLPRLVPTARLPRKSAMIFGLSTSAMNVLRSTGASYKKYILQQQFVQCKSHGQCSTSYAFLANELSVYGPSGNCRRESGFAGPDQQRASRFP